MRSKSANRLIRSLGMLLAAVALLGVGFSLLSGHLLSAQAKQTIGHQPGDFPAESVGIRGPSGQVLRGWYARTENARATVLPFHPLGGSRRVMLGRARFLHRAGYDVLAADFRAHGESDGERVALGPGEAEDVVAAVD